MSSAAIWPVPNHAKSDSPSVTGVGVARLCFSWRSGNGPRASTRCSQTRRPSDRSKASTIRETGSAPPGSSRRPPIGFSTATSAASSRASCGWAPLPRRTRPVCDVTKIRSPQTTGEDDPSPRSAALHAMFSRALHLTGSPVSPETPDPDGPRHCGQFAAIGATASRTSELTSAARLRRWFPRMGET